MNVKQRNGGGGDRSTGKQTGI